MQGIRQLKQIFRYINNHPLAGKHRLKAYGKFLQWQVGQFISPGEKKIAFTDKTWLSVKKGMAGATGNIYTGLHEFSDMAFLLHLLRKDDLFADIGANIGSYTVLAAGQVGAKAICFEPLPATFRQLEKNISINHLERLVTAYNKGVGSTKTTLLFTSSYDTVNHVVAAAENNVATNAVEVEVLPLDDVLKEAAVPLLVKIDVEGFETEVIKGMKRTLADQNLKAIIIELNGSGGRYGYDESLIHQTFMEQGFQPYLYDAFKRVFTAVTGYGSHNTLYLRDMDFINERIQTAGKVVVFSEAF